MQHDNLVQIANRQRVQNVRDMLFVLVLVVMLAVGIAGWRVATAHRTGGTDATPADNVACAPVGQAPAPALLRC